MADFAECLIALSLLAVLPLVRRYAYEAFLYSHLALAIILAIVLWEHLQLKRRFSKILLLLASVSFLITSALSYLHQAYRNISWTSSGLKLVRACWSQRFGDSLIVELKLSRSLHVIPGQHIFLTFLTLRYGSMFQRHPLMVTWWRTLPGETEARSIFVVIRQQRGWTRRLLTSQSSFTGCAAWIDGPFGTSYDLQEYGTVLMFASGDGIFAQLPFIKSLTEDSKRAAIKTRRIKLVWQTEEYHGQLQQWMQSILDDEEVSLEVSRKCTDGDDILTNEC
ncbi:uncharacterized protein MYCGRDRAFT_51609 [Zymoseptoria tritici IPO323]|uniref:FAD-binding 8 domain-containing protein n=1 Tax=Zymoseptoria tritici (strain CBS 115943 / IPO323) TaxID=336722 RepID=F9XQN5_ZYMTI|nr:uncharacterized protein MYCGRDRAFT_51609 [Zymoseptoria tritici IPO323]EGP82456.1 hypothetical protein MYCGRDRAFT_51609 [Zymoseptoria tritici IPO323]